MHTATLSSSTYIVVTNPFLSFYGKKYLLIKEYIRDSRLILQCIEESTGEIATMPAIFTDYFTDQQEQNTLDIKSHFTIQGLADIDYIIDHACVLSTE